MPKVTVSFHVAPSGHLLSAAIVSAMLLVLAGCGGSTRAVVTSNGASTSDRTQTTSTSSTVSEAARVCEEIKNQNPPATEGEVNVKLENLPTPIVESVSGVTVADYDGIQFTFDGTNGTWPTGGGRLKSCG